MTGNTTLSGTLAVTGTSAFTGAVSFATNPTFTSGRLVPVVNLTAATTATVTQSGSTMLFNSATGIVVTLPAPTVGTTYDFVVGLTPSSGTHGIRTNAGSVFLKGAVYVAPSTGTLATFLADGSTATVMGMSGTTTGGIQGSHFRATCVSATNWEVTGNLVGSGGLATPFV